MNVCLLQEPLNGPFLNGLRGPDGSRHSSEQHPKDVNSDNSNECPFFVRELCPAEGKLPRYGLSDF